VTALKNRLVRLFGLCTVIALLALSVGSVGLVNAAPSGPCGTTPLAMTNYTHVVWLWMENHSYDTIMDAE